VYLAVKPVGEPDAGDRHVRFDERGWETERCRMALSYRAHPRLYHSDLACTAARLLRVSPRASYCSANFYCGDRPITFLASDRNSEAVEFIKPKPVHCSSLSVS
jgi:hypothetical protein